MHLEINIQHNDFSEVILMIYNNYKMFSILYHADCFKTIVIRLLSSLEYLKIMK